MNELLKNRIHAVRNLCNAYKVRDLFAFGSVLTDRFSDKSDIDFLVSFTDDVPLLDYADNYFDFKDKLSKLLGRDIDLVMESSLSNPFFIKAIERTKTRIYG